MHDQVTPTSSQIRFALDNGATAQDIDEMFYPGESHRSSMRKSQYPIPEGTGRRSPYSDNMFWVTEFKHDQFTTGVRERQLLYIGDIYIGYIDEIRRGMCDIYYRTHDGEEFAHWGGVNGAEPYLIDRYWSYGNPPEKKYKSKHPTFGEFKEKVKSGKIEVDLRSEKAHIEWRYKRDCPWIHLTDEMLNEKALMSAYYESIERRNKSVDMKNAIICLGLLVLVMSVCIWRVF